MHIYQNILSHDGLAKNILVVSCNAFKSKLLIDSVHALPEEFIMPLDSGRANAAGWPDSKLAPDLLCPNPGVVAVQSPFAVGNEHYWWSPTRDPEPIERSEDNLRRATSNQSGLGPPDQTIDYVQDYVLFPEQKVDFYLLIKSGRQTPGNNVATSGLAPGPAHSACVTYLLAHQFDIIGRTACR